MDKTQTIQIAGRPVGLGHPCFLIAEVGMAHDGSLGAAHAYIDAVADSRVDAIKFQTHVAEAESTPGEPFRVKFSKQDASRYGYWQRTAFTAEQWQGLADHCAEQGLIFLSSPFSIEAVELLDQIGMPAWKVAAGETSTLPMLRAMAETGRPVLLSSGMSPMSELDAAVACVGETGAPVAVFQCTTAYPCPPEKIGLNVLDELRSRYACPVGLSDHSGAIYAGLAAATLGANLLEVHITFSRDCFGPDVPASLTPTELKQLADGVRFIETMLAHPVDKDAVAEEMAGLRRTFNKSVVLRCDLPAGHRLAMHDLAIRKPGTGIAAARLDAVVGRTLQRAVEANIPLMEDDLG